MKRTLIAAGLVLAGGAGFGLALAYASLTSRPTTVTRLSPDETVRARLVERWGVGRNPVLQLEYLADGREVTIFRSPDAGGPEGTERLIWSKDGTRLLLVGRHFFVKDDLFLDNGDQLFFLYHLPTGKGWCNDPESRRPPLKAEQVRGFEFTEPVVLKGG